MFPLGTNGLLQAAQTIYKQVVDEFNFKMGLRNSSLNYPQLFKFLASVDIRIGDLPSKKLSVNNLFRDIVIEHDISCQHENLTINFGGKKPSLSICGLSTMMVDPPSLFSNLSPDCRPLAKNSRR